MSTDAYFKTLRTRYEVECEELNMLDAAIRDAHHGTTMLRGLARAANAEEGKRAKALMRASGGASGALFGLILVGIETHLDTGQPLELARPCARIEDAWGGERGRQEHGRRPSARRRGDG